MLVSARNFKSRGCRTRIARKVKCDQTRPACLRCTRTNRECGKYRDQHELIFRPVQIQPPIKQSWKQLAIPFFFANHTIPAARGRPGHLDFIPDLYGKPGSNGRCFHEALLAVSASHFARYRHDAVLHREAMLAYGKALSSLRLALSDDKLAQQNGTVIAMLLLSRLETISGEESTQAGVHFCAGVEMMKFRKPEYRDTMAGRIFHFMRLELAVRNLCSLQRLTNLEPISPFTSPYTMRSFAELLLQAETACLELWTSTQACDGNAATEEELRHLEAKMHQVLQILQNLSTFELTVESGWKYTTIILSSPAQSSQAFNGNEAIVFPDIQLGAQWMALWCAHVRLTDTLAAGLTTLHESPLRLAAAKHVLGASATVEKVCAAAPFMLGRIDSSGNPRKLGDLAVGPAPMILSPVLYIAGTSFSARTEQKLWICDRLAQIGQQRGIGQALVFEKQLREMISGV